MLIYSPPDTGAPTSADLVNQKSHLGQSLTIKPKYRTLICMSRVTPTVLGMNTDQLAKFAKRAVDDAVAANIQAGNSLTGLVEGRVQTLKSTDPKISKTPGSGMRHVCAA